MSNATLTVTARDHAIALLLGRKDGSDGSVADVRTMSDRDLFTVITKATQAERLAVTKRSVAVYVLAGRMNSDTGKPYTLPEIASQVGLGETMLRREYKRGAVLVATMAVEDADVSDVLAALPLIGEDSLPDLAVTVAGMPESERVAHVVREGVRANVAKRLGESATPAGIDAVTAGMLARSITTGDGIRSALDIVAGEVSVPVPAKAKRAKAAEHAAGGSDVTVAQAIATLRDAIAKATGTGDAAPHLTDDDLTAVESLADDLIALAASEHEARRTVAAGV